MSLGCISSKPLSFCLHNRFCLPEDQSHRKQQRLLSLERRRFHCSNLSWTPPRVSSSLSYNPLSFGIKSDDEAILRKKTVEGRKKMSTVCSAVPVSTARNLQWISTIASVVLMLFKGTAVNKCLLVPLLALQEPTAVVSWVNSYEGESVVMRVQIYNENMFKFAPLFPPVHAKNLSTSGKATFKTVNDSVLSSDDDYVSDDLDNGIDEDFGFDIPDGVRMSSESTVDFRQVKSFDDFDIIVNGLVINSELSKQLQLKYYDLCRSQKSFLHEHVLKGLNCKLIAGVISETVNIADGIRASELGTQQKEEFVNWENTLLAFEKLGMNVEFMLTRLRQLMLLPQVQNRYSEPDNCDWHERSAAPVQEKSWEAFRERKEFSNGSESRKPVNGHQELNSQFARASISNTRGLGPAPTLVKAEVPWSARRGTLSDNDRILKTVKGILNKLTPEKFDILKGQLIDSGITTPEILKVN